MGTVSIASDARLGRPVELALPAPSQLSGTAATSTGELVEQFQIELSDALTGKTRFEVLSGAGGRWRLDKVQPGKLHLSAQTENAVASAELDVRAGSEVQDVRLVFMPVPGAR